MRALLIPIFLGVLLSPPAWAQPKKIDKKTQEEATKAFEQGQSYFKLNDFEKALESYKKAYVLTQEPLLLFNIGQCYRNMKEYQKALDSYQLLLTDAPNTSERKLVEAQISEVKAEMAKQAANNTPATVPGPDPKKPKESGVSSKTFFKLAGVTGGLAVATGAFAFIEAAQASKIQNDPAGDPTQIEAPFKRARLASHVADGFLVAAIAAGGLGFVRSKQDKKTEVSLAPSGVSIQVQF